MPFRGLYFEPAVYEHKAALIGKSPAEVSRSADLLARSLIAEYRTYQADFMTVGIDVYNLEIETIGAELVDGGAASCPDVRTPPFTLDSFEAPALPGPDAGRFAMMIDAARLARGAIPAGVALRVAASGPATIASRLVGLEPLVLAIVGGDERAAALLEFSARLAGVWIEAILAAGFDAIVFDSTVAPPVFSPSMYASSIARYHRESMSLLEKRGRRDRPLIVGGNTVPIVPELLSTGATTLICDFAADAEAFKNAGGSALRDRWVRRNVDPALFRASGADLEAAAWRQAGDLSFFPQHISGTGILPYDSDPARYIEFRALLAEEYDR